MVDKKWKIGDYFLFNVPYPAYGRLESWQEGCKDYVIVTSLTGENNRRHHGKLVPMAITDLLKCTLIGQNIPDMVKILYGS